MKLRSMKRIYIVEDHEVICQGVVQYLSLSGYEARGLKSIEEARAAFSEAVPDLLVEDVMLPDGDGFSFVKELKAKYPDTLVLPLSIYRDDLLEPLKHTLFRLTGAKEETGFTARMDMDAHYRDEE